MRRRSIFLVLVVLLFTLPAAAQGQSGCDINLVDTITALLEAQRMADQGDAFKSVQAIKGAQAQLDAILSDCEGVSVPLGRTFTSPDELFTFSYPEGWAMQSPQANTYVMANTQQVLNMFLQGNLEDPFPPDAQTIALVKGDMSQIMGEVDSFDEFVERFKEQGLGSNFTLTDTPSAPAISNYEYRAFAVRAGSLRGTLYILNLGADNQVVVTIGITPNGGFDAFEPVFTAVVESIRYGSTPPRSTGKSLDEITYASAVSIRDLIEGVNFRNAVLSPDGSAVAWYGGDGGEQICLFTFADSSTACTPVPELARGTPPLLLWSPDSQYIAFTADFVRFFVDADIWLFDRTNQQIFNRTDDGINRWRALRGVSEGDSAGPLWLDYVFTWGPDGSLYFIRQEAPDPAKMMEGTTGLYRAVPDGDKTELIRDLSGEFDPISVYFSQSFSLSGPMAVSPDGKSIALIVMEREPSSPANGVWTMPLSGKEAPVQIAAASSLRLGLPGGLPEDTSVFPMGVAWSQDGKSLFIFGGNPAFATPLWTLHHVDLATGEVTPMRDFSGLTQPEMYATDPATGVAPIYYMPRAAVMSPDGTTPIVFNSEGREKAEISALRLVDGEVQPALLYQIGDYAVVPTTMSSVASDGKVLMYGYLFMPEE